MRRMKVWTGSFFGAALLGLGLLVPGEALAQSADPEIGVRAGYLHKGDNWSLGGQFRMPVGPGGTLVFLPSADAYFGDGITNWQLNADAALSVLGALYGGGGVAIVNRDVGLVGDEVESKTGWNAFAGIRAPGALVLRPYAEARWTFLEGESPFFLTVGANLALPGRAVAVR